LIHETGHVLGGLGDEYDYAGASTNLNIVESPNTTQQTNFAQIKWKSWIATNTPLPTPPNFYYSGVVGLFLGANYQTNGWYRPKFDCMMNSKFVGFCEVCTETMVLSFYRRARPIDGYSPATTSLVLTNSQPVTFSLSLLQPCTHSLSVQWSTNGVAVPAQTNANFTFTPTTATNGSNLVSVRVLDATSWVHTDPSNLLSQTLAWNVTVSLPQLTLSNPRWLGTNGFAFRIGGNAPGGFSLHSSSNLTTWTALSTNNLVNGFLDYTNKSATNAVLRFYRAVTPPSP
jgi:hypothetical protein